MKCLILCSLLTVSALSLACKKQPQRAPEATAVLVGVVDSALPMSVLLDRFRSDIPKVDQLRSEILSRDTLIRRVVSAIASSDTAALQQLAVNRAEYAWLYFPTTKVSKPPYEAPPAFAWFQVEEKNRRGVLRALRELGGRRVELRGYHCDEQPTIEAENRMWTGCEVSIARDGQAPVNLRLFGAILERGGRFEVLSYQNDF